MIWKRKELNRQNERNKYIMRNKDEKLKIDKTKWNKRKKEGSHENEKDRELIKKKEIDERR